MANIAKMFGGIVLIAVGTAIIYGSNLYHLIDIFIIIGIIIVILGLYVTIVALFEPSVKKSKKNAIKELPKSPQINSKVSKKGPVKLKSPKINNKINNSSSKPGIIDGKKIANTVKKVSGPINSNKILKSPAEQGTISNKRLKFTPNYEKPMKITRRPKKRISSTKTSQSSQFKKSEEIEMALASDDFIRPIHAENKDNSLELSKLDGSNSNKVNNTNTNTNTNIDTNYNNSYDAKDTNGNSKITEEVRNIDLSSSDSLPLPKLLKSYVICAKGTMTSQEAFEELARHAKNEILLEISSLKDMTEEFLSELPKLDVRIIIEEFDLKDMSYVLLIRSLIEQGIKIKTMSSINTINLISDDSHALIISENDIQEEYDIGAVYTDLNSISNIKSLFNKSWDLANDLEIQ